MKRHFYLMRNKRLLMVSLIAIVGTSAFTGLFVFTQGSFHLIPDLVAPPPTEIKIGLYPGQTYTLRRQAYTKQVRKFEVMIKEFSEELQLKTLSDEPIEAPFDLQPITWDSESQFAEWGFRVAAPESIQPGMYEVNLVIRVSNWFSSEEYPLKITVIVEPLK